VTALPRTSALDLVLSYHRAWTCGDIDRAMTRVAEDIVCHAPGQDLVGKDAYRAFLANFAPLLTGLTDVASVADDDNHVILFYYPHTSTTSAAPAAEYFTVQDGAIVENLLVFDRLSFAPPSEP
jgi:ketosteroid isomerase-like protein